MSSSSLASPDDLLSQLGELARGPAAAGRTQTVPYHTDADREVAHGSASPTNFVAPAHVPSLVPVPAVSFELDSHGAAIVIPPPPPPPAAALSAHDDNRQKPHDDEHFEYFSRLQRDGNNGDSGPSAAVPHTRSGVRDWQATFAADLASTLTATPSDASAAHRNGTGLHTPLSSAGARSTPWYATPHAAELNGTAAAAATATTSFLHIPPDATYASTDANKRAVPSSSVTGVRSTKPKSTPSYALPTKSSSQQLSGAATPVHTTHTLQSASAVADATPTTRLPHSKKKRTTPVVDASLLSRPLVKSSYGDLLSYSAVGGTAPPPLPLTLHQAQACIVHVLRTLQATTVDATAMHELKKILHEHGTASASNESGGDSAARADRSDSDASFIASLQADQDALLASQQRAPRLKLVSQLPRGVVSVARLQSLFRWHLADLQRRGMGIAAAKAQANATGPAVSQPSSTHATPARPPTVVGISLSSPSRAHTGAVAPLPLSAFSSLPSSGMHTPMSGASSSGGVTVSQFFNATTVPPHASAATPIAVRPDRYERTPSRLLDHFRRPEERAARSRSHSRSQSHTRRESPSVASTPRGSYGRSASLDRPSSRSSSVASTPRRIPNHALAAGRAGASFPDDDDEDDDPLTDRTIRRDSRRGSMRTTTRARSSSAGTGVRRHARPSIRPHSLHVADFSEISSTLQMPPLSTATSNRIDSSAVDPLVNGLPVSAAASSSASDPDMSAEVMAQIESMNRSLEVLLARETTRQRTIRRPRAIFPGAAAIYDDDPDAAARVRANHQRARVHSPPRSQGRALSGSLTGRSEPPHIFSPSRAAVTPRNPHAYVGPSYSPSGHRSAGQKHTPRARDMAYLDFEVNLRHARESEGWRDTLDGRVSAHRAALAASSPVRERSRSRSHTPSRSPKSGVRILETVPQARHMGYLSHEANAELFRQTSTYATILAGGSTGGSSQPPISYVRDTPVVPDRSIRDPPLPQARHMAYLAPEVNNRHIAEARTWSKKLDGTYVAPRTEAVTFKYRPEEDPVFRHNHGATMITQARHMAYLPYDVNDEHFKQAQLLDARVRHAQTLSSHSRPASASASPIASPRSHARTPRAHRVEEAKHADASIVATTPLAPTPLRSARTHADHADHNDHGDHVGHHTQKRELTNAFDNDARDISDEDVSDARGAIAAAAPSAPDSHRSAPSLAGLQAQVPPSSSSVEEVPLEYDAEYEAAERYYTAMRAQQSQAQSQVHGVGSVPAAGAAAAASVATAGYDPFAAERATLSQRQRQATTSAHTTERSYSNGKQLRPSKRQQ